MKTKYINDVVFTIVLILLSSNSIKGQQDAQYSQFMYNKLPLNAAYTGSRDGISIRALYRDQWVAKKGNSIEGAPKTTSFSIHSPLKKVSSAIGFYFINDRIGLEQKNQFDATYSYRITISKNVKLNLGLNAGFLWYKLNVSDAVLANPDDNKYRDNISRILPDVGAGIYIYHTNFYFGVSVPNFIKGSLSNKGDYDSKAKRTAHFVLMAGGLIPMGKYIKIRPQFQYSYIANNSQKMPHAFDFNLSLLILNRFNVGAQYHATINNKNHEIKLSNPDSIDFMLEIWPIKQLMIGYSYDYTLSKLARYNSGSHEIILGYDISPKKKKNYYTGCYHF